MKRWHSAGGWYLAEPGHRVLYVPSGLPHVSNEDLLAAVEDNNELVERIWRDFEQCCGSDDSWRYAVINVGSFETGKQECHGHMHLYSGDFFRECMEQYDFEDHKHLLEALRLPTITTITTTTTTNSNTNSSSNNNNNNNNNVLDT